MCTPTGMRLCREKHFGGPLPLYGDMDGHIFSPSPPQSPRQIFPIFDTFLADILSSERNNFATIWRSFFEKSIQSTSQLLQWLPGQSVTKLEAAKRHCVVWNPVTLFAISQQRMSDHVECECIVTKQLKLWSRGFREKYFTTSKFCYFKFNEKIRRDGTHRTKFWFNLPPNFLWHLTN